MRHFVHAVDVTLNCCTGTPKPAWESKDVQEYLYEGLSNLFLCCLIKFYNSLFNLYGLTVLYSMISHVVFPVSQVIVTWILERQFEKCAVI